MQRLAYLFVAAILAVGIVPHKAQAQAIEKRIERLEKQLRAVQRKVFEGRDVAFPADGADTAAASSAAPAQAVDMERRIMALEEQLRMLTGQIEELQFQGSQTKEQLDNFMADAEFRFGQLEGKGGTTAGPAGAAAMATTPSAVAAEANELPATPAAGDTASLPEGVLPAGTASEQYNYAYSLLAQGKYDTAEAALRAFVAAHPKDDLAGNAQYWLGQSLFVRGRFNEAAREFVSGYQTYPKSSKAPAYLLKIGISLAKIGQKQDACDVFTELKTRFPDSPESKDRRPPEEKAAGCS